MTRTTRFGLVPALILVAGTASAQSYPVRAVRLVVPIAPGGSTDVVARAVAARLGDAWKHPVVVENRPGGGTVIGTELVARSAPDGHTLLVAMAPLTINPGLLPRLPYDALVDFDPITLIARTPLALVVNPTVPAKSVKDLVALARAHPGRLNFGSAGTGGSNHLAGELFNAMAGVRMVHVPYKGNAPALTDLVGGHIDLIFNGLISAYPLIKGGRIRALAVTSRDRSAIVPDLPTIAETGLAGFEAVAWVGLAAPAGTPREVVARISADVVAALRIPALRERLTSEGSDPVGNNPAQFAAFLREEIAKWARVIRVAGVKAD